MSLVYINGFDYCVDASKIFTLSNYNVTFPAGRTGNGVSFGGATAFPLPKTYSEIIVGFAFKRGNTNIEIIRLKDSANAINITLDCSSVGILGCKIRNGAVYYSTGYALTPSWCYIEVKTKIHDTSGYVIIRVDGTEVLNVSNIDTCINSSYPNIYIIEFTGAPYSVIDDLYVCDTTGTKNNDFLGDVKVLTLFPQRNGSINNFTPVGDTINYKCVDENPPDNDTTYVTSSGVGNIDLYGFYVPVASGQVLGAKLNVYDRKDDSGTRMIKLLSVFNSLQEESESFSCSDTYIYHSKIFENRPTTSDEWSLNDFNTAEFGVKIVAS